MDSIKATCTDWNGKVSISKKCQEGNCQFPFMFNSQLYHQCVTSPRGDWCATQLTPGGYVSKMGYCPKSKAIVKKDLDDGKTKKRKYTPPKTKKKDQESQMRKKTTLYRKDIV